MKLQSKFEILFLRAKRTQVFRAETLMVNKNHSRKYEAGDTRVALRVEGEVAELSDS